MGVKMVKIVSVMFITFFKFTFPVKADGNANDSVSDLIKHYWWRKI